MNSFVSNAEKLNLTKIVSQAVLNGMFFAISMSWDRAISGAVALFFSTPDSVPALFAQAFTLTCIISLFVFIISFVFREETPSGEPVLVARIGSRR